nr:hypothetical protein [Bartonella australis]
MEEINTSTDFDKKLCCQDIENSFSHALILAKTKTISQHDYEKIIRDLKAIRQEIEKVYYFFTKSRRYPYEY